MTATSDTQTTVLNRRLTPLGKLRLDHKNWVNPRSMTGLSEEALDELSRSIETHGIEVPPHVVQVKGHNGEVFDLVIDGQRRVLSSLRVLSKDTEIEVIDMEAEPIELTPKKAAELLERALVIGEGRKQLSSYELSEAAEKFRDAGLTNDQIGRAIFRSPTWVSKMLKARATATPKLMLAWKKAEVTDEMFKDLAALEGEKKQGEALGEVKQARESGDKSTARLVAKEKVEKEKATKATRESAAERKANGVAAHPPIVKGPQADLFEKREAKPAPETPKSPPRAVLEDLARIGDKKPPTHDYVKGIMDGVRYCLGFTSPDKFAQPWVTYLARVEGRAVADVRKERKAARKAAKKTSRPRKPAKKAKGRSGKKARR